MIMHTNIHFRHPCNPPYGYGPAGRSSQTSIYSDYQSSSLQRQQKLRWPKSAMSLVQSSFYSLIHSSIPKFVARFTDLKLDSQLDSQLDSEITVLIHKLVTGPPLFACAPQGEYANHALRMQVTPYSITRMGAEESTHVMNNRMGGSKAKFVNVLSYSGFSLSRARLSNGRRLTGRSQLSPFVSNTCFVVQAFYRDVTCSQRQKSCTSV